MALTSAGLAKILPNGQAFFIALGTAGDPVAGTLTETTAAGYSRVSHNAWVSAAVDGVLHRRNNGAILFPAFTEVAEISWWGIYDVSNNLLAVGPLLNSSGVPEPQTVESGDQPRFSSGELRLISTPEEV